jgi:hypothetical protein
VSGRFQVRDRDGAMTEGAPVMDQYIHAATRHVPWIAAIHSLPVVQRRTEPSHIGSTGLPSWTFRVAARMGRAGRSDLFGQIGSASYPYFFDASMI